jgi:hypothetical protein
MEPARRQLFCIFLAAAAAAWPILPGEAGDGSKPRSAEFQRFQQSFFEDSNSARDGLDEPALAALQGSERAAAEEMLIAFLPDARGIIGLGILRSKKTAPQLQALFDGELRAWRAALQKRDLDTTPNKLIYLAKTLWLINPQRAYLDALAEILKLADFEMQRHSAAEAFFVFRDPAAVPALVKALDDQDELVRFAAAQSLLAIHGLPDQPGTDAQHMMYRVMNADASIRLAAKGEILSAIEGKSIAPME